MTEQRPMGKRVLRGLFAFLIVFVGIVITALLAMNRPSPPQLPEEDSSLLVEVLEVQPQPVQFHISSRGNVIPRTETSLVAQVSGRIVQVSSDFVPGGFFKAGEMLLKIDPSDYQVAVKRAEAELAGRKAQLASEVARARQAEKDWRSVGKGEASDLVLRKPQMAEAQAAVNAAEADLERARRDLERTEISLPYTGLVRSKSVDIGQFVNTGSVLGSTFAVDYAEVRLPLTDTDVAFLNMPTASEQASDNFVGPEVTLNANLGGRSLSWHGHITRTEGVIDPKNRVLYAVARVSDPYNLQQTSHKQPLQIGQYVSAEISGVRMDNLATVPRHALRGRDQLLIADSDNRLQQRKVAVVRADQHSVYINGGLEDGDRVILTALEAPIEGTQVRTPDMLPNDPTDDSPEDQEMAPADDALAQATPGEETSALDDSQISGEIEQ